MDSRDHLLLRHLEQFVSEHKQEFVNKVLYQRTRQVTVVLEDIYQSQNASAAVRTCECLGLQDIYIIENTAQYQLNVRVLKGSDKWIDLIRYRTKNTNNTEACFSTLRSKGYKILVADPGEGGLDIHQVDFTDSKLALVFGNELRGVSRYALQACDQKIKIPMYGFTESLNISVSVAICLHTLMSSIRQSAAFQGLSQTEQDALKLKWYRKIVKRSEILEREFLRTIQ